MLAMCKVILKISLSMKYNSMAHQLSCNPVQIFGLTTASELAPALLESTACCQFATLDIMYNKLLCNDSNVINHVVTRNWKERNNMYH